MDIYFIKIYNSYKKVCTVKFTKKKTRVYLPKSFIRTIKNVVRLIIMKMSK